MENTTIEAFAQNENVNIDDAREAILRALRNGDKLTQLTLVEQVIAKSGVDVATVFVQAMDQLIAEGLIYSSKGRNGGLKLGERPAPSAKTQAAALLAMVRKSS